MSVNCSLRSPWFCQGCIILAATKWDVKLYFVTSAVYCGSVRAV